jgi:hypothetical protein
MFAYGNHYVGSLSNTTAHPLIMRTTDGGVHWGAVYDDTNVYSGGVSVMSDINRDTIVAGVDALFNKILISTDRGTTWGVDTLICSNSGFSGYNAYGVGLNAKGDLIGAFGLGELLSSLIIGHQPLSGVKFNSSDSYMQIYPNPASEAVNIAFAHAGIQVSVIDLLGQEVLRGVTPEDGPFKLDVSSLPSGLYFVTDGNWRVKFAKE